MTNPEMTVLIDCKCPYCGVLLKYEIPKDLLPSLTKIGETYEAYCPGCFKAFIEKGEMP